VDVRSIGKLINAVAAGCKGRRKDLRRSRHGKFSDGIGPHKIAGAAEIVPDDRIVPADDFVPARCG
jgi:hypothetical protein